MWRSPSLGVYRRGVTDQSESPGHDLHRSFLRSCARARARARDGEYARPSIRVRLSFEEEPGIGGIRIERIRNSRKRIRVSGPPYPLRRGEASRYLRNCVTRAYRLVLSFSLSLLSSLQEASSTISLARCPRCSLLASTRGSLNASAASVCTSDRLVNHSTPLTRLVDAAKGSSRRFSGYFYRRGAIPLRLLGDVRSMHRRTRGRSLALDFRIFGSALCRARRI